MLAAYNNSETEKSKYVSRMQAHIDADELVKGLGFEDGRGCAVGCTLNKYEHSAYESELGMPVWVAKMNDELHENTSDSVWPTLQLNFLQAVPVGFSEWEKLRHRLCSFIQARNIKRVQVLDISDELKKAVIDAIAEVKSLHDALEDSEEIWSAARSAWSAAESAARSAARSAWSAAWSAAGSAESAARSAAGSAESAAWSAAGSAESAARSAAGSAESAESAARSAESAWSAAWSAESAESAAWSAARSAESAEYDVIANEFIRLLTGELTANN